MTTGADAEPYVDGGTNFISLCLVIELGSIYFTDNNYRRKIQKKMGALDSVPPYLRPPLIENLVGLENP